MHMLDVVAPYPTSSSTDLRQPQEAAGKAYPIRQRPKLPRRSSSGSSSSSSSSSKSSQGRQGGGNRVRKRTPSPAAANRRNAAYFDTLNTNATTAAAIMEEVTLSALDTALSSSSSRTVRFPFDPSMYKLRENLLSTCVDAANSVHSHTTTTTTTTNNDSRTATVDLSSGRRFMYNNEQDVLHLRFVVAAQPSITTPPPTPPLPPQSPPLTYARPIPGGKILHKGIISSASASSSPSTHPLSAIFQALWSPPLARALHTARRIAIDVSQTWPILGNTSTTDSSASSLSEADQQQQQQQYHARMIQDIVFLACTIQNDLEVLYLVDYSSANSARATRTRRCSRHRADDDTTSTTILVPSPAPAPPSQRTSPLYRALNPSTKDPQEIITTINIDNSENDETQTTQEAWDALQDDEQERDRQPDVIHGVGRRWRETFDLEALGWHEKHPGFVFGETLGEVIRLQQGSWHGQGSKRPTFKGVRVLVVEEEEDDEMDGVETTLGCGCIHT